MLQQLLLSALSAQNKPLSHIIKSTTSCSHLTVPTVKKSLFQNIEQGGCTPCARRNSSASATSVITSVTTKRAGWTLTLSARIATVSSLSLLITLIKD